MQLFCRFCLSCPTSTICPVYEPQLAIAVTCRKLGASVQDASCMDLLKELSNVQGDAAVRIELHVALLTPSKELKDLMTKLPDWLNVAPMVSFQSSWTF